MVGKKSGICFFNQGLYRILAVLSIAAGIFLIQNFWPNIQRRYDTDIHVIHIRKLPMKKLPQVLIIGVKKCGTATLKKFLGAHPSLAVNTSELHFFDKHYDKGYNYYLDNVPPSFEGQITIEGSPRYFVHPEAYQRIRAMNSSIKLILIVTDPSRRLVSDYMHERAWKKPSTFPKSFVEAVFADGDQVLTSYEPVTASMYAEYLKRWYSIFPKDQILILDGDNFIKRPWEELKKVEGFLHIQKFYSQSSFIFSEKKRFYCLNQSGIPQCMPEGKGRKHQDVPANYMNLIRQFYAPYNEEFFKMTGLHFEWNKHIKH